MRRFILCLVLAATPAAFVSAQGTPVPRPFPGGPTPPSGPASPPSSRPQPGNVPSAAPAAGVPAAEPIVAEPVPATDLAGVPLYPTAEYLETIDAGAGQSYHLYGTDARFSDIVAYYRNLLGDGGRTIYRTPAVHQFDVGEYDDDEMVFPPSVVVKDYAGGTPQGYLHVDGTTERRYATIIQIVPPAVGR